MLSGPTVDILVGQDRKCWTLHRRLLCHHSTYLRAELISKDPPGSSIGNSQKVELLDDEPSGFELFVKWLYQGNIDDVSDLPIEAKYDYCVACQKLYTLCDRLEIVPLKVIAMDQYRRGLLEARLVPDAEELTDIYCKASRGSPFRILMTRIAARQIMDPRGGIDAEAYRACFERNADFAIDLVNAIKTGTGGTLFDDPTESPACEYHGHVVGQTCADDVHDAAIQGKLHIIPAITLTVPAWSMGGVVDVG